MNNPELGRTKPCSDETIHSRPAFLKGLDAYLTNKDLVGVTVHDANTILRFRLLFNGTEQIMMLSPQQGIIFGRTRNPIYPGTFADLSKFDAYQNGVSRSHAQVKLENNSLHLYDLGSSNGTFLNGQKLNPMMPYRLRDGDMIIFGKLEAHLAFIRK